MAEPNDSGLFREIDDELRQEHYAKLWKRYGAHVIALAALLVVGVAGHQGWKAYDHSRNTKASTAYAAAMRLGDQGAMQKALAEIGTGSAKGYAMLARFREAALLAENGKPDEAADRYRALSADSRVDVLYRDMAVLMETALRLDRPLPDELSRRLADLTAAGNPWRHLAREFMALAHIGAGKADEAKALLDAVKADRTAPETSRRRAADLLKTLGS